MTVEKQLQNDD